MNEIQMMKEELTEIFSDDPIIWGKWILVFIAFILTYVIIIKFKLNEKLNPNERLDKKVQRAIENKHIINAKLIKKYTDTDTREVTSAIYEYEVNGKMYKYRADLRGFLDARTTLHLYYENTPQKLFTNEEHHNYGILSLPWVILNCSPFLVVAFMIYILGLMN